MGTRNGAPKSPPYQIKAKDRGPADSQISNATSMAYWNQISPDVSGMLGGYPQVSRIDLQGSKTFLTKLRRTQNASTTNSQSPPSSTSTTTATSKSKNKLKLAVDCGAGIGRVTSGFLSHVAETVDIVEPVEKFATTLVKNLSQSTSSSSSSATTPSRPNVVASGEDNNKTSVLGQVFVTGLESWRPAPARQYDLIWNQWCLGHLTDRQLIDYLKRCIPALKEDGWIVVKENLSTSRSHNNDSSHEGDEIWSSGRFGSLATNFIDTSPNTPPSSKKKSKKKTPSEKTFSPSNEDDESKTKRPKLSHEPSSDDGHALNATTVRKDDRNGNPHSEKKEAITSSDDDDDDDNNNNNNTENGKSQALQNIDKDDLYDALDSSVTRSDMKFRYIFSQAGLEVIKSELQTGFPKGLGLYPVKMYALRPK